MPEWLDIAVRSVLFVVVLFFMTKLVGKKQIAQLSFFEYVTGITIGSIAAESIMGLDGKIINGLIAMIIVAAIPLIVGLISLKSKKFRDFTEGKGTIFVKDGKVMEDNLKRENYSGRIIAIT